MAYALGGQAGAIENVGKARTPSCCLWIAGLDFNDRAYSFCVLD